MKKRTRSKRVSRVSKVNPNQRAWRYIEEINRSSNDNLNKIALIDGKHTYTYGAMFHHWERYAAVFSALEMTGEHQARVGMIGSTAAETIFALYGLNIVGAAVSIIATFCAFNTKRIIQTIQDERYTDIILTDDYLQPNLMMELFKRKEELGLRNILLIHIPFEGAASNQILASMQNTKYLYLQQAFAPICMDTLLSIYGDYPITYAAFESQNASFILHTSGTTTGVGKPIALSDHAVNSVGKAFLNLEGYDFILQDWNCTTSVDLSNAYGFLNQIHNSFALGGTVATVPFDCLNPFFYKAVSEYKTTLLFANGALFELWMKMPETTPFDFSTLKGVVVGGTSVSAKNKKRYYEFLKDHGAQDIPFINGYGVSELGGACILSTPDLDDEAIGYALPGVELCFWDEEGQVFHTMEDIPCTGVMYIHSFCMAGNTLDGKEYIKTEMIEGKDYICTNDLVSADETGKITYLGRANRYFINQDGVKYEAGRVETEVSRQAGIESCGVVPVFEKLSHDNVPMLCVKPLVQNEDAKEVVRRALLQIFKVEKTLPPVNIPYRVLIANDLPRNKNGKIDICKIEKEELSGRKYKIETIRRFNQIMDFKFVPIEEESDNIMKVVTKSIAKDFLESNIPIKKYINKEKEDMKMNNDFMDFFKVFNQMGQMNPMNFMNQMGQINPMNFMNQMGQMNPMNFMNQMGQMNPMNFMNQMGQMNPMNFMNQMCQMMKEYTSQMYQMNMKMAEGVYEQNMQLLKKMNEMFQNQCNQSAKEQENAEDAEPAESEE